MDELIQDFLVETKEGLDKLDNDLIILEKNPEDKEVIGTIFRIMHTIKGTCGFLGLSKLESVAHAGEDVFDLIRDGKLSVTDNIISILFEVLDAMREIIAYLEENEIEPEIDCSDLVNRLRACAEGPAAPVKEAEPIPEPEKDESEVVEEIGNDSDDLQRLFDETESLVDIGQNTKPEAAGSNDSDDLQKLFDETESLVDVGQYSKQEEPPKTEEKKVAPPPKKEEKKDDAVKKSAPSATIRVSLDVLEELMQYASELVLTRNQLMQILRTTNDASFATGLQRLNAITTSLQEGVMKTRMQPVGNAWTKLPRIVRDLAQELGKKIELKMIGEETELDRQLLELITDPLTHMVRNSADHGLEDIEGRKEAGKAEIGNIELKAYQGGGYIIIEISDDGRGIDPEKIKQKAISNGLISDTEAEAMNDTQILQFIFAPGFSTAEKVTSVSGRGVGMDVVKTNIEKISGTVDLKSTLGKGSVFTIKIPLTLAIMSILQVGVGGQKFAIPQINITEIVKANKGNFNIENINNKPVLRIRKLLLPLVSLSEALGLGECDYNNREKSLFVVVCEIGSYKFGIIVEEILDTEEIVVKPVSPILKEIDVYSGCTILGDGSVILILDPTGLARTAGEISAGNEKVDDKNAEFEEGETASFIVFKAGDATPKVVPLEVISRLEEIDVASVEYSRGKPVVQYRGDLMKIEFIDDSYKLPESGVQEMLVISSGHNILGLAVDEILDIAKCTITEDIKGGKDGFLGSMVINNKTCDVVNIGYYFNRAFEVDESESASSAITAKKKVLLVDDSQFFRKFIPPELREAGYTVKVCANAMEAMDVLESGEKFSVVVTDINMPGMSGYEFAEKCKTDERFSSLPFVALSSHTDGDDGPLKEKSKDFDAMVSKTNHDILVKVLEDLAVKEVV